MFETNTLPLKRIISEANVWSLMDSLRGVAALGVALYHLTPALWIGWNRFQEINPQTGGLKRIAAEFSIPALMGYSFVMLFFVISGFCIHYPNAGSEEILEMRPFLYRRFLRIYPPYLAAIALTAILAFWTNGDPLMSAKQPGGGPSLIENVFMLRGGLASNGALWSLPIEMHFYLLYPLLLMGWRKNRIATLWIVGGTSVFAAVLSWIGVHGFGRIFPLYWIVWVSGMGLANTCRAGSLDKIRTPLYLIGAAAAAVTGAYLQNVQPIVMWLPWGVCYYLLIAAALKAVIHIHYSIKEIFLVRCAAALGVISYSFYLIHVPIFGLEHKIAIGWIICPTDNYLVALSFVAMAVLASTLFYALIERPSHRCARMIGARSNRADGIRIFS